VEPGKKEKWDLTLKRKLGTVKGTVADAATGQPIAASFSFIGKDLPQFNSNPQTGEYSTLVPPGKYNLSVTADGYRSQNMELTTRDRKEVVNNLTLQPIASAPVAYNTTPAVSAPPPAPKPTVTREKPKAAAPKPTASAKLSADEINALYKTGVKQSIPATPRPRIIWPRPRTV